MMCSGPSRSPIFTSLLSPFRLCANRGHRLRGFRARHGRSPHRRPLDCGGANPSTHRHDFSAAHLVVQSLAAQPLDALLDRFTNEVNNN